MAKYCDLAGQCDKASSDCLPEQRKTTQNESRVKEDEDMLKVVDTSEALTLSELHELKKLAAMSKVARTIIAVVIGGVALLGADKIFDLLHKVGT